MILADLVIIPLNPAELRTWGDRPYLALTAREALALKQILEQELARLAQHQEETTASQEPAA